MVRVGPGNGAALARRFAREGLAVALLARGLKVTRELEGALADARAYACDVAVAESVAQAADAGQTGRVFLRPDDLAETVYRVTQPPRSVWSFEVEARPIGEGW